MYLPLPGLHHLPVKITGLVCFGPALHQGGNVVGGGVGQGRGRKICAVPQVAVAFQQQGSKAGHSPAVCQKVMPVQVDGLLLRRNSHQPAVLCGQRGLQRPRPHLTGPGVGAEMDLLGGQLDLGCKVGGQPQCFVQRLLQKGRVDGVPEGKVIAAEDRVLAVEIHPPLEQILSGVCICGHGFTPHAPTGSRPGR